jgi:plasmid stabilization system protein ParE
MSGYVFTQSARRDLIEIWEFIARDNIDAADGLIEQIETAAQMLAELPHVGRERSELTSEPVRFWRAGAYLLVYLSHSRPLQIVRVLHGARDVRGFV